METRLGHHTYSGLNTNSPDKIKMSWIDDWARKLQPKEYRLFLFFVSFADPPIIHKTRQISSKVFFLFGVSVFICLWIRSAERQREWLWLPLGFGFSFSKIRVTFGFSLQMVSFHFKNKESLGFCLKIS